MFNMHVQEKPENGNPKPRIVRKPKPELDRFINTETAKKPLKLIHRPSYEWEIPTSLPDLSQETEVAIDIETKDINLKKSMGPGFHLYERGNLNNGFICGVSVAWRDQSTYIPIRHEGKNYFSLDLVGRWMKATTSQTHTRFIFHNFQYDWGWIQAVFGIPPSANIDDTLCMASMVNENLFSYSLDRLCAWYKIPGKKEQALQEISKINHLGKQESIKGHLSDLPAYLVGPYASQDAASTLELSRKLRPLLEKDDLMVPYKVEQELMPITLRMKQRGIRVNRTQADNNIKLVHQACEDDLKKLCDMCGKKVTIEDIRSSRWLKGEFINRGLPPGKTAKGNASFGKVHMAALNDEFTITILRAKHLHDIAEKFLKSFICDYAHNGRVYPSVNQFKSERGGTKSHRFSYSDPPLQQTPSRDNEFAPMVRSCFVPEEGEYWCSIDYAQQEYRLIVYVAEVLKASGAKRAADMYRNNPDTDFHNYVAEITGLERRRAKDVNFAKSYGAGVRKFAEMTGMDIEEAEATMAQYDTELPFVRIASERYTREAMAKQQIRLIDRALSHFNLWEPKDWRDFNMEDHKKRFSKLTERELNTHACDKEEAEWRVHHYRHPWYQQDLRLAFTHKAFNRMIQGSAARQIKKAMVDLSKAGYEPLLQLHDELAFSFTNKKQAFEAAKIMEEAMPKITIPMLTDVKWGSSWGKLEKIIPE